MKLYMHAGACSLSPHIVLRELGLDFQMIAVDRATHRTSAGEDYYTINANGYVPALALNDGAVLTEGPAIVQYLADLKPASTIMPTDPVARAQVRSLLNYITSELHKPMVMLFQPAYAQSKSTLHDLVSKRLGWIAAQMKGPFLTGADFTVADAYLFVCLNWSPWIDIELERWPALVAFFHAVAQRPAVQDALRAEGLGPQRPECPFFAPQATPAASAQVRP